MTTEGLPQAVIDFFEATNTTDRERFLAAFSDDAVLDDWGHQSDGRDAIGGWNETDNMGVSSHFDVLGHEIEDGAYVVSIEVRGVGYNGRGAMSFRLDDDLISRIVITG
jgi:ketosteroid isomerase-like protein